jgi:hypothetical protein
MVRARNDRPGPAIVHRPIQTPQCTLDKVFLAVVRLRR